MKVSSWSIAALAALFTLGLLTLLANLYRVQVVDVAKFKEDLAQQATRRMRKPGIRGRILDARGGVLAESRARRDLVCDLSAFIGKSSGTAKAIAAVDEAISNVANALGFERPDSITPKRIARHIRTQSAVSLCVWRDIDERSLARFEERAAEFP